MLGELGEYPVDIFAFSQMIQYWHKLKVNRQESTLVYQVSNSVHEDYLSGHFNWLNTIKFLSDYCVLNHIWLNPKSISTKALGHKVKPYLEQSYGKFFNEKLADPTSSYIKIHAGKQPSGGNKLNI